MKLPGFLGVLRRVGGDPATLGAKSVKEAMQTLRAQMEQVEAIDERGPAWVAQKETARDPKVALRLRIEAILYAIIALIVGLSAGLARHIDAMTIGIVTFTFMACGALATARLWQAHCYEKAEVPRLWQKLFSRKT